MGRHFPMWLQRIIVGAAIFGGAWYVVAGYLRWLVGAG